VEQELQDRVARAAGMESREELLRVHKEIVDFHGEMVLLENYSALNYTGEHFSTTDAWRHLQLLCGFRIISTFKDVCCLVYLLLETFVRVERSGWERRRKMVQIG
jgi:hypothetical protein